MSFRSVLMFFLAIACAGAASFGVYQYTKNGAALIARQPEKMDVVVLRVDVPRVGTQLTEDMLELVQRPKESVSEHAISDLDAVVGQSAVIPMFRGEPVVPAKLGQGSGLAALVPEGMVAFTFQAPSESSLMAGFAMPNDRVDILLTRIDASQQRGGKVTQRLVQNVRLLAAGVETTRPAGNRVEKVRNVTVAVLPGTDQKLAMAQEIGSLALVLRSSADDQNHPNEPIYLADLEGAEEEALVDKWDSALSHFASSAWAAAAAIEDISKKALDAEIKRLNEELAMKTQELEEAREGNRLLASQNQQRQNPTAVLTIRGNSQSYVTVKPRPKKVN